ncbi:STAM-binding protein-like A [Sarcoptes scabiei]|nr:STAM-binding protein-like A [Sarcoptes scabiei]
MNPNNLETLQDDSLCINVNFCCQRCCQPLKLHPTLSNIKKETFLDLIQKSNKDGNKNISSRNLLNPILSHNNEAGADEFQTKPSSKEKDCGADVIYKTINSFRNHKINDCDFSLISTEQDSSIQMPTSSMISSSLLSGFDQSTSDANNKTNKDLWLQIQLFDILSDQSDIDHPLCEECADFVIEQMDKQLVNLEQECQEFADYRKKIEQTTSKMTKDEEVEALRSKLNQLNTVQNQLMKELQELNKQHEELDKKLEHSKRELKQSKTEEEKYWHEHNTVKFNYFRHQDRQITIEEKIRNSKEYYNKLKRTSIFNLTFTIWYKGPFGTINCFRLGRLPNIQVEWHEINAAWGQCALLLSSLAKKLSFNFERYRIVPYGNFSFIESLDDRSKQLPLYTTGGLKFYFHQKFDQAMVAFLDCLQQFYQEIQRQDSNFKLPYQMDIKGDLYEKANNIRYSIKININTEEKWTKALKFMLTNLKWILALVASKHPD